MADVAPDEAGLHRPFGYLLERLDLGGRNREELMGHWQQEMTAGIAVLDPGEPGQGIA